MANKGGKKDEHRMLFDLRGRRRNVVKVVYAVLAVLMGLSLLLIAGPLPFGDIFGGEDASELAQDQAIERSERVEAKLAKDPGDETLLLSLTKAHLAAGSSMVEEVAPEQIAVTPEARQQYEQAASSWDEYLEATAKPSSGLAQQMSNTFLQLAETTTSRAEAATNIKAAAEAQGIVAEQRPSVGALGTEAIYTLYTFDFAAARAINEEAKKLASSKLERDNLAKQFAQIEKRAKEFRGELREEEQLNKAAAQEGQAQTEGGEGPALQNPFQLGGG